MGFLSFLQVADQDMPEIDQKSFDGINAQLERDNKSESVDPASSVSAEVEAPLLSYIIKQHGLD